MDAVEFNLPRDYNYSFIVFQEKGQFFPAPWHYHEHYEIVMVKQSTGRRMVGDHIGIFAPGDLVLMGPMLPHVWVNDDSYFEGTAKEEADAIVIHFTKDFLDSYFMDLPELDPFEEVLKLSKRGMAINGIKRREINDLIKDMPDLGGLKRLSHLFSIFHLLSKNREFKLLASPSFNQKNHNTYSKRFKDIMEFILENYDRSISLEEVSDIANMSVTTFCNYFKEQFRMTFVEYLNSVRIGHVCDSLSHPKKNIAEIAYENGFNNISNFNRQFKKYKEMTPSAYRKKVITSKEKFEHN